MWLLLPVSVALSGNCSVLQRSYEVPHNYGRELRCLRHSREYNGIAHNNFIMHVVNQCLYARTPYSYLTTAKARPQTCERLNRKDM
ncbi:hypothetical protein SCHPADRAFT_734148 [Schizopora paradoxa]|uniref:Uncharacterized protein n=1 Tax=Schizopora paradoxa TaxID=27342 RepID=A0A0H2R080_9AGAM|nr:hypothetical protein SCHPADRAFT_734148 [Schizopora paradoxa]